MVPGNFFGGNAERDVADGHQFASRIAGETDLGDRGKFGGDPDVFLDCSVDARLQIVHFK